ncbi:MAG: small multi-drug export protein [bacterium]|nr:small multi-drug export protein [bacterium]
MISPPPVDQEQKTPHPLRVLRSSLFTSPEGHILVTGLVVGCLYLLWIGLNGLWEPKRMQNFVAMTATHVLFGRAAGMSFGYTVNLGHGTIILTSMTIESIVLLFFYPFFVFSWRHLLVFPALKKMMDRLHQAAEKHHKLIHHYGLFGLFALVWFPFWMTGSLVGCIIGFLLELRPWVTIAVVLGGGYMAIVSWSFLLQRLHDRAAEFGSYASLTILALLILLALLGSLAGRKKQKKKE